MHGARNFLNLTFEYTTSRRIGHHNPGCLRTNSGLQRLKINVPISPNRHFFDLITTHYRRRRICTVRSLWHNNFSAGEVAALLMISFDHRHAGKFTLRTSHWTERYSGHTGHFFQYFLQLKDTGQIALAMGFRSQGMTTQKA